MRKPVVQFVFFTSFLATVLLVLASSSVQYNALEAKPHAVGIDLPEYPFINYRQNKIQYYGDTTSFNRFYNKLDELIFNGQGRVNILHMGGSHVQAGVLSNRLRENLFSLSEGIKGPRGFLFPFRLAHTNGPGNFKVEYAGDWEGCKNSHNKHHCNWGASGYTATTLDSNATFKLWSFDTDSVIYPFTKVKVFYDMIPESFSLALDSSFLVYETLVDSTDNSVEFFLGQAYDTLQIQIVKTDSLQTSFTLQGLRLDDFSESGLVYNAIGVNGASVPSYLRCALMENQLRSINPDLVIFGIGINDAYQPTSSFNVSQFEMNYDSLIQQILHVNPYANFLFLTNNDSYYKRRNANRNALGVREGMINLAKKYDGAVWDLFEIMGGLNSIRTWEQAGLAKSDKIHFTSAGYTLQADLLFYSLREAYGDYLAR